MKEYRAIVEVKYLITAESIGRCHELIKQYAPEYGEITAIDEIGDSECKIELITENY